MNQRRWNFLILGGTSFVARHLVEFLSTKKSASNTTWAVSVRSESKREEITKLLSSVSFKAEVVVANASDRRSLDAVISQAQIVLNFIGPYDLYSHHIIDSCLENKTHYFDITGEFQFIRRMIDRCHKIATENKTLFIPSSGFDSVPSDYGCFSAIELFQAKYQTKPQSVVALFNMKGGLNGGSFATMLDLSKKVSSQDLLSANLLAPDYRHPPVDLKWKRTNYRSKIAAPFFMAPINVKNVVRSLELQQRKDISYQEYIQVSSVATAKVIELFQNSFLDYAKIPFVAKILKTIGPQAGTGPSEKTIENGFFSTYFIANGAENEKQRVVLKMKSPGDPGNGATVRLMAAAFSCFQSLGSQAYGVQTAASAFGKSLLPFLQENDITIEEVN